MANKLSIFKDTTDGARLPFRIIETYETIDGFRSRLTSKGYTTQAEAQAAIDHNSVEAIPYGD